MRLWFLIDIVVVDISTSLNKPALVRLYTRHAMMLVITIFGVADIERSGIGTVVSNTMITVTMLDTRVILAIKISQNSPTKSFSVT